MPEMHGPNKMALSPVPVMWEQLPVTEGIFKDDSKNTYAPQTAKRTMFFRLSANRCFILKKPITKKGRHRAPHATQDPTGR